jgi:type IV secretory pathway VirB10-like protein
LRDCRRSFWGKKQNKVLGSILLKLQQINHYPYTTLTTPRRRFQPPNRTCSNIRAGAETKQTTTTTNPRPYDSSKTESEPPKPSQNRAAGRQHGIVQNHHNTSTEQSNPNTTTQKTSKTRVELKQKRKKRNTGADKRETNSDTDKLTKNTKQKNKIKHKIPASYPRRRNTGDNRW